MEGGAMRGPIRAAAAATCLFLLTLGATDAGAQSRVCVRAPIAEPFLLPDGSLHREGLLRICLDHVYTPAAVLHTIVTADGSAGVFLGRRQVPEGRMEARSSWARFVFTRNESRTLSLLGYAVATGGATEIYWIRALGTTR
jgi:hypothetical protein